MASSRGTGGQFGSAVGSSAHTHSCADLPGSVGAWAMVSSRGGGRLGQLGGLPPQRTWLHAKELGTSASRCRGRRSRTPGDDP